MSQPPDHPAQQAPDYTPIAVGPDHPTTGDPLWIEPQHREGGALPGDHYSTRGRWRQPFFPTADHPADSNHRMVGRVGLLRAWDRLYVALSELEKSTTGDAVPVAENPHNDPVALAIAAAYEGLEWVHSLDEHFQLSGSYANASDLDADAGPVVEAMVGARNASHHGLRRVLGVALVPIVSYVASDKRWELNEPSEPLLDALTVPRDQRHFASVRWTSDIPERVEALVKPRDKKLRSQHQRQAFLEHLAGRDVRSTFGVAAGFLLFTVEGKPSPNFAVNPALHPQTFRRLLPGE